MNVLEAFRDVAIEILQRGVIFQNAAFHFEIVDASGEGVGERFEDEDGKRLRVVVFAFDAIALAAGFLETKLRSAHLDGEKRRPGK